MMPMVHTSTLYQPNSPVQLSAQIVNFLTIQGTLNPSFLLNSICLVILEKKVFKLCRVAVLRKVN